MLRLSASEGGRRRRAIQTFLTEHDCQAYVVFTSDNFFYVSNFREMRFFRNVTGKACWLAGSRLARNQEPSCPA